MTIKELLTLIVATPIFLFLSGFFPPIQILFMVLWILCLSFDVHSTYQFYLENPSQFSKNERNKLFVWLTKKFGFKKATILFPIAIEIPILLFFAFLPLQTLHTHMFPTAPNNLIACIATSFGISAIGHLQAAITNTQYNNKNQTQQLQNSGGVHDPPSRRYKKSVILTPHHVHPPKNNTQTINHNNTTKPPSATPLKQTRQTPTIKPKL